MKAEIRFFDQHMNRFLHADAVVLGQVLAQDPVKRTIDEDHLHVAR